jgi:hypothetical protein
MRLALQKKRWIEMQLHEVVPRTPCFHSRFHLAPNISPLHSIQDIRNVPAADRKRRNQRNAGIRSAARCRYTPPAISFRQTHAVVLQNPKSAVDFSNPAVCVCCALHLTPFAVRRVWAIALLLLDKASAKVQLACHTTNAADSLLDLLFTGRRSDVVAGYSAVSSDVCTKTPSPQVCCRHIHLNETHAGAGSIFTQLKVAIQTCPGAPSLNAIFRRSTRHATAGHSSPSSLRLRR